MEEIRNPLASAIRLALGAGALAGLAMTAAPVHAQDEEIEAEEEERTLDRLQVTGSRIISPIVTSSAPVTEIGEEEFQYTGTTRVEDLLQDYPQIGIGSDAFINNGSAGFPSVSLRGLGSVRTLTLVNGHRLPPGGIRSEARDLNQIPAALVKRVEILTGGASAVYGSDAMAGVVNFILDNEFEGVSLQAGYSGFQSDNDNKYMRGLQEQAGYDFPTGGSGLDGESKYVDIAVGSAFAGGRGHAMGWVTYRQNDPLLQAERDHSSCALNNAGTACGGSSTAADPNFLVFDSAGFGNFVNRRDDLAWERGVGELYNFAPINFFQRDDKRWTFGSSINYEINEHFRPYVETMFARNESNVQIAESGTFFVNDFDFECDNPLIGTLCQDANLVGPINVSVGKRNVEGGPRIANLTANNFRVVTGVRGDLNQSWSYDMSYLHAINSSSEANENDFIPSRLDDALLLCPEGSAPGCVPLDVWTNNITSEQALAQGGVGMRTGDNQLQVFNAYVTGDTGISLPSADGLSISLVAGYEWRRETFDRNSDANMAAGNFAGLGGPRPPISGEIKVNEFFLESAVPILADVGVINNVALDLGYRMSDYNTSGTDHTWKIGFTSQFLDDYRLRGGFNRAIRSANTGELFAQQQIALFSGGDPCAGDDPTFTLEQCARTGVTAEQFGNIPDNPASQYNQFIGGNTDLSPEEADTWTIGVVATPVNGLELALDYWDIDITDRIGTIGAQTILNFCATTGDPFLCDKVNRNPQRGDIWVGSDPASAGFVENVTDNFGDFRFRGIDLNASYRFAGLGGQWMTSFTGSYFIEQEVAPLPGVNDDATYDCAGRISISCQTPNWRHVATTRYSRGDISINARWRMIGRMIHRNTDGTLGTVDQILVNNDNRIGSYHYYDVSASYSFLTNYSITLGANNIFDKKPPLVGGTLSSNANTLSGYDQVGRFVFGTIGIRF